MRSKEILRTEQEIMAAFEPSQTLALDIETTGLDWKSDQVAVLGLAAENTDAVGVLHTAHTGISDAMKQFLNERDWITHNGTTFDNLFLGKQGMRPMSHWDTLIGESVLLISDRKNLKRDLGSTMQRRIGYNYKESIPHNWGVEELSEEQVSYAAADIGYLFRIRNAQIKEAQKRDMVPAILNEMYLTKISSSMSLTGLTIDLEVLGELQEDAKIKAQASAQRLIETFGESFNVNSPKQVKEGLAGIGIELESTRKDLLAIRPEEICRDILRVREWKKRSGMYSEDFVDKFVMVDAQGQHRLHGIFRQASTGTLRYSSANPNLQQIPRDYRGMVGGAEGQKVVKADWAQIEVLVMAHLAGDPELFKALESEDFHYFMAEQMFDAPITKEKRRDGKAGTFTWCFGGSAGAVVRSAASQGQVLDVHIARRMLSGLNRRFRKTYAWHRKARFATSGTRSVTLELPWKHRRQIRADFGGNMAAQWCNTQVQGTAAIGMKESLFEIERRGILPYLGAVVHDEIVLTGVPEKDAAEVGQELKASMQAGMQKVLGLETRVDLDIEDYWTP